MDTRPSCCEPCKVLGSCRPQRNCCLECHFGYEETLALPHLPPVWQERVRDEHVWLEANGFPAAEVAAHALWEEEVFRRFCPTEICEILERDHLAHGHGHLVSRVRPNLVLPSPRPSPMFSSRWTSARVG
jgi:hypothetical protein